MNDLMCIKLEIAKFSSSYIFETFDILNLIYIIWQKS